jgi:hypothetical protein
MMSRDESMIVTRKKMGEGFLRVDLPKRPFAHFTRDMHCASSSPSKRQNNSLLSRSSRDATLPQLNGILGELEPGLVRSYTRYEVNACAY